MKLVFTIGKKLIEEKQLKAVGTQEIVVENVKEFNFNESIEKIKILYNDGREEALELFSGNDEKAQQWFFLDIKCFQIPLKI